MELGTGGTPLLNAYYGQGTCAILLENVMCTGSETSLLGCPSYGLGVNIGCTHAQDASVQCAGMK